MNLYSRMSINFPRRYDKFAKESYYIEKMPQRTVDSKACWLLPAVKFLKALNILCLAIPEKVRIKKFLFKNM